MLENHQQIYSGDIDGAHIDVFGMTTIMKKIMILVFNTHRKPDFYGLALLPTQ
jgi:hypothetical protein